MEHATKWQMYKLKKVQLAQAKKEKAPKQTSKEKTLNKVDQSLERINSILSELKKRFKK
jgi:predicted  nucleic acid-binding Zn-ribbon protein